MSALFVSWVNRTGRSADLAAAVGAEDWSSGGGRGPTPVRWARLAAQTWRELQRRRPRTVLVMQPPPVALWLVAAWARRHGARVIADLHTSAVIGAKWAWAAPIGAALLRRHGLAVVTNEPLAERVRRRGVRALVLHDVIAERPAGGERGEFDDAGLEPIAAQPYVLLPLSYAADEPIDAMLRAATLRPAVRFVLTGPAPAAVRAAAPRNAHFTGMVSDGDYRRLLDGAAVVTALTTWEWTMQRAGYEALVAGKPLLASETGVLREYFDGAAVLSRPIPQDLADGLDRLMADLGGWADRMVALRSVRIAEQQAAIVELTEWMGTHRTSRGLAGAAP